MASAEQILELRRLINEPPSASWSDEDLSIRIDSAGSMEALASQIWGEKAAAYAGLVDVREGNSQRSLGNLHQQALRMSEFYASGDVDSNSPRHARTRQIERM